MKHGNKDKRVEIPGILERGPRPDNPMQTGENAALPESLGMTASQNPRWLECEPWMGFPQSHASPRLGSSAQPAPEPSVVDPNQDYADLFGLSADEMRSLESDFLAGFCPVLPSNRQGGEAPWDLFNDTADTGRAVNKDLGNLGLTDPSTSYPLGSSNPVHKSDTGPSVQKSGIQGSKSTVPALPGPDPRPAGHCQSIPVVDLTDYTDPYATRGNSHPKDRSVPAAMFEPQPAEVGLESPSVVFKGLDITDEVLRAADLNSTHGRYTARANNLNNSHHCIPESGSPYSTTSSLSVQAGSFNSPSCHTGPEEANSLHTACHMAPVHSQNDGPFLPGSNNIRRQGTPAFESPWVCDSPARRRNNPTCGCSGSQRSTESYHSSKDNNRCRACRVKKQQKRKHRKAPFVTIQAVNSQFFKNK